MLIFLVLMIHLSVSGQINHPIPRAYPEARPEIGRPDTIHGHGRIPDISGSWDKKIPHSPQFPDDMPVLRPGSGGEILVMRPDPSLKYSLLIKKPYDHRYPSGTRPHMIIDSLENKSWEKGIRENEIESLKKFKSDDSTGK